MLEDGAAHGRHEVDDLALRSSVPPPHVQPAGRGVAADVPNDLRQQSRLVLTVAGELLRGQGVSIDRTFLEDLTALNPVEDVEVVTHVLTDRQVRGAFNAEGF